MNRIKDLVLVFLVVFVALVSATGKKEAGTAQPVTITFWYQADVASPNNPWVVWYSSVLKTFAEKYPNIKVEPTVVSDGNEYLNKISTAMAAGNSPDVFKTWLSGRLEPFVTAGRVQPLNDIIDKSPALKKVLNMAYLDTGTFNGKIYAIPVSLTDEVIFYNKAIFQKCGLSIPKKWDDLIAVVKSLKANGFIPDALGNKSAWRGSMPYMAIFDRMNGAALYNEVVVQHKAKWDDPAFVRAAEYLVKYRDAGAYADNFNSLSSSEGTAMFTSKKAGMLFTLTGDISTLGPALGSDLGFFDYPVIPAPAGTGKKGGSLINKDNGFAIGSNSAHKEEAATLFKHIFSQASQKTIAELGDLIACVNIDYDKSKVHPILSDLAKFIKTADYPIIPWDNPLGVNIGKEFNLTTQAILGGANPKEAFQKLQKVAAVEWGTK
jgi:raffinose/stachyose/melibiose transport system substrate-binding protein